MIAPPLSGLRHGTGGSNSAEVSCLCEDAEENRYLFLQKEEEEEVISDFLDVSKTYLNRYGALLLCTDQYHDWKERSCVNHPENMNTKRIGELDNLKTLKELRRLVLNFGLDDSKLIKDISKLLQDDSLIHVRAGFSPNRYLASITKLWDPKFMEKFLKDEMINRKLLKKYYELTMPDTFVNEIRLKDSLISCKPKRYNVNTLTLPKIFPETHLRQEHNKVNESKSNKESIRLPKIKFGDPLHEIQMFEHGESILPVNELNSKPINVSACKSTQIDTVNINDSLELKENVQLQDSQDGNDILNYPDLSHTDQHKLIVQILKADKHHRHYVSNVLKHTKLNSDESNKILSTVRLEYKKEQENDHYLQEDSCSDDDINLDKCENLLERKEKRSAHPANTILKLTSSRRPHDVATSQGSPVLDGYKSPERKFKRFKQNKSGCKDKTILPNIQQKNLKKDIEEFVINGYENLSDTKSPTKPSVSVLLPATQNRVGDTGMNQTNTPRFAYKPAKLFAYNNNPSLSTELKSARQKDKDVSRNVNMTIEGRRVSSANTNTSGYQSIKAVDILDLSHEDYSMISPDSSEYLNFYNPEDGDEGDDDDDDKFTEADDDEFTKGHVSPSFVHVNLPDIFQEEKHVVKQQLRKTNSKQLIKPVQRNSRRLYDSDLQIEGLNVKLPTLSNSNEKITRAYSYKPNLVTGHEKKILKTKFVSKPDDIDSACGSLTPSEDDTNDEDNQRIDEWRGTEQEETSFSEAATVLGSTSSLIDNEMLWMETHNKEKQTADTADTADIEFDDGGDDDYGEKKEKKDADDDNDDDDENDANDNILESVIDDILSQSSGGLSLHNDLQSVVQKLEGEQKKLDGCFDQNTTPNHNIPLDTSGAAVGKRQRLDSGNESMDSPLEGNGFEIASTAEVKAIKPEDVETDLTLMESEMLFKNDIIRNAEEEGFNVNGKGSEKQVDKLKVKHKNVKKTNKEHTPKPFHFGVPKETKAVLSDEKPKVETESREKPESVKKMKASTVKKETRVEKKSVKNMKPSIVKKTKALEDKKKMKKPLKVPKSMSTEISPPVATATLYSAKEREEHTSVYTAEMSARSSRRGRLSIDSIIVRCTPDIISDSSVNIIEFKPDGLKTVLLTPSIETVAEIKSKINNEHEKHVMDLNKAKLFKRQEKLAARREEMERKRLEKEQEKQRLLKERERAEKMKEELAEEEQRKQEEKLARLKEEQEKKLTLEKMKKLKESEQARKRMRELTRKTQAQNNMQRLLAEKQAELEFKKQQSKLAAEIEADLQRQEQEMLERLTEEEKLRYEKQKKKEEEDRCFEEEKRRERLLIQRQHDDLQRLLMMKELEELQNKRLRKQYFKNNVNRTDLYLQMNQKFSKAFTYSYCGLLPFYLYKSTILKNRNITVADIGEDEDLVLPDLTELLNALEEED